MHTSVEKKGWICLDIDGTITTDIHSIPKDVLAYLKQLQKEHWNIVFVTGRTFTLAYSPLKEFDVPYYLVPQNGASAFKMPEQKLLFKSYLPVEIFLDLEKLLEKSGNDFVLFGGLDQKEICYYRPERLSRKIKEYFLTQLSKIGGNWKAVDSFKRLDETAFPFGKIYGEYEDLKNLLPVFEKVPSIKVHLVKDALNPQFYVIHIMKRDVDKGRAVLKIMENNVLPKPIISAGNDANDESLLQVSDIKIAMPDSPKSLLDISTIIAPSAQKMGIIDALKIAVEKAKDYE